MDLLYHRDEYDGSRTKNTFDDVGQRKVCGSARAEIPETGPSETNIGCHTCLIESTAAIAAEASF